MQTDIKARTELQLLTNTMKPVSYEISRYWFHFETEFDRFLRIHKVLEKKSITRPLWFHYKWENIFEMRRNLDEINSVYRGQKLGISADLTDMSSKCVRFFSDHDINRKIT